MAQTKSISRAVAVAWLAAGMAACGGGGSGAGPAAQSESVQIETADTQASTNSAPIISGSPSPTAIENTFYEFTPSASDPDGDPIVFEIEGQPAWADFDRDDGRLFGTPGAPDVGLHEGIVISASDGKTETPLPAMAINVMPLPENRAPEISGIPAGSVLVGDSYSFVPVASDADGDGLSFTIENQPAWAIFDTETGSLGGAPSAADIGQYIDIGISVSDGTATASLDPFVIVVNPPPIINSAPGISGQPPTSVIAGEVYGFTPSASDADGDVLSFGVVGAPLWTAFDAATGTLSGTPNDADVGIHGGIAISVTDGEAEAVLGPFSIEVIARNTPPEISGIPTLKIVKGESYLFVPSASDADGDGLTFSVAGAPDWATFDTATGELSGSPAAQDVGIFQNITISVTDGEAQATLGPFAIEVLQVGPRSAELTWVAPTENSDGSPLTDLAGYVVYWGSTKGNHSSSVTLENPGLTAYVVENLAPGQTYFFVVTAYNEDGLESENSNEASKSIADDN